MSSMDVPPPPPMNGAFDKPSDSDNDSGGGSSREYASSGDEEPPMETKHLSNYLHMIGLAEDPEEIKKRQKKNKKMGIPEPEPVVLKKYPTERSRRYQPVPAGTKVWETPSDRPVSIGDRQFHVSSVVVTPKEVEELQQQVDDAHDQAEDTQFNKAMTTLAAGGSKRRSRRKLQAATRQWNSYKTYRDRTRLRKVVRRHPVNVRLTARAVSEVDGGPPLTMVVDVGGGPVALNPKDPPQLPDINRWLHYHVLPYLQVSTTAKERDSFRCHLSEEETEYAKQVGGTLEWEAAEDEHGRQYWIHLPSGMTEWRQTAPTRREALRRPLIRKRALLPVSAFETPDANPAQQQPEATDALAQELLQLPQGEVEAVDGGGGGGGVGVGAEASVSAPFSLRDESSLLESEPVAAEDVGAGAGVGVGVEPSSGTGAGAGASVDTAPAVNSGAGFPDADTAGPLILVWVNRDYRLRLDDVLVSRLEAAEAVADLADVWARRRAADAAPHWMDSMGLFNEDSQYGHLNHGPDYWFVDDQGRARLAREPTPRLATPASSSSSSSSSASSSGASSSESESDSDEPKAGGVVVPVSDNLTAPTARPLSPPKTPGSPTSPSNAHLPSSGVQMLDPTDPNSIAFDESGAVFDLANMAEEDPIDEEGDVHFFLHDVSRLGRHEVTLHQMGVRTLQDLAFLSQDDLDGIGFTYVERHRLWREMNRLRELYGDTMTPPEGGDEGGDAVTGAAKSDPGDTATAIDVVPPTAVVPVPVSTATATAAAAAASSHTTPRSSTASSVFVLPSSLDDALSSVNLQHRKNAMLKNDINRVRDLVAAAAKPDTWLARNLGLTKFEARKLRTLLRVTPGGVTRTVKASEVDMPEALGGSLKMKPPTPEKKSGLFRFGRGGPQSPDLDGAGVGLAKDGERKAGDADGDGDGTTNGDDNGSSAGSTQFQLEDGPPPEPTDLLIAQLSSVGLLHYLDSLRDLRVSTPDQLLTLTDEDLRLTGMAQEEVDDLRASIKALAKGKAARQKQRAKMERAKLRGPSRTQTLKEVALKLRLVRWVMPAPKNTPPIHGVSLFNQLRNYARFMTPGLKPWFSRRVLGSRVLAALCSIVALFMLITSSGELQLGSGDNPDTPKSTATYDLEQDFQFAAGVLTIDFLWAVLVHVYYLNVAAGRVGTWNLLHTAEVTLELLLWLLTLLAAVLSLIRAHNYDTFPDFQKDTQRAAIVMFVTWLLWAPAALMLFASAKLSVDGPKFATYNVQAVEPSPRAITKFANDKDVI